MTLHASMMMQLVIKRFLCPRLTAYTKHSHLLNRMRMKKEMMQDDQFMDNPKREICRMKELTTENIFKALEQETGTKPILIHNPNDTLCAHSIIMKLNTYDKGFLLWMCLSPNSNIYFLMEGFRGIRVMIGLYWTWENVLYTLLEKIGEGRLDWKIS